VEEREEVIELTDALSSLSLSSTGKTICASVCTGTIIVW
jgi:hypothetical protein